MPLNIYEFFLTLDTEDYYLKLLCFQRHYTCSIRIRQSVTELILMTIFEGASHRRPSLPLTGMTWLEGAKHQCPKRDTNQAQPCESQTC